MSERERRRRRRRLAKLDRSARPPLVRPSFVHCHSGGEFSSFFAALSDLAEQLFAADESAGVDLVLPVVAAAVLAPLHCVRPDQGGRRRTRGSRRSHPRPRQVQ